MTKKIENPHGAVKHCNKRVSNTRVQKRSGALEKFNYE